MTHPRFWDTRDQTRPGLPLQGREEERPWKRGWRRWGNEKLKFDIKGVDKGQIVAVTGLKKLTFGTLAICSEEA